MRIPARTLSCLIALTTVILLGTGCSPEAKKAGHLKSADRFFESGEFDQAEIEYINVLKLEEGNAHATGRLALIYTDQGRLSQAVAYLRKGRQLDPENLDLRVKMGQLALATGNLKEARDEANYLLDRRPQDPEAPQLLVGTITKSDEIDAVRSRLQGLPPPAPNGAPVLVALGLLEFRQQHFKEAEADLKLALAADPKFAAAYSALGALSLARKDSASAEQAFRQAAELSSLRSPRRLQFAQYKMQAGDLPAAKRLLEEITLKAPDYLPAWTALAEIALVEKKFAESASYANKALARDPANLQGLIINGRSKLAQGEYDQAIAAFEKLADTYPKLPTVYYELGRSYAGAGEMSKAIDRLNQASNLAPGYTDAVLLLSGLNIRKGELGTAVVLLRKLVQQRPDLPAARLLLADAYRAQGNLDESLAVYQQVEEQFPQNRQTPYLRGMVLLQQNKQAEARIAFERAHELAPDSPIALEQLINLELRERKYQPARDRLQAELDKNPKLAGNCQLLFAKIFLAQDDKPQAEAALKKAIELMPDSSTSYFLLAGIYTATSQQQKALTSLEQALVRNPKDTTALMLSGVIHDQQKEYPAAQEAYEKILAINPRFSGALNNLAYLYAERLNQLDKAYTLAQRAREQQPTEPHVADTLGWILYAKHQYARALSLLEESAEKLPALPEVQFHLGMTHYMMGEEEPARLALHRALQAGSDFNGLAEARKSLAVLETDVAQAGADTRTLLEKIVEERKNDPVALSRLAGIYERDGNLDKAIGSLESALQANPGNVSVLLSLARLHATRKDAAKALDLAKAARKLAPDDPTVARTLGRLAYQMGDFNWATSLLQEAARKQTDSADLFFDLAEASYSIGRVSDAEAALNSALQVGGLFLRAEEARRFLGLIAAAANPGEAVKQADQVEQLLQSDPAYVPALMVSGLISEQRIDLATAQQTYEKILSRFPEFTPAKLRLGVLGAARPEFDQRTYDLALQARTAYPTNPELTKALGILTYRKGDFTRATALLKESSVARDTDAELWYYLGMAQVQAKDPARGQQSLRKALEAGLRPDLATEARKTLAGIK